MQTLPITHRLESRTQSLAPPRHAQGVHTPGLGAQAPGSLRGILATAGREGTPPQITPCTGGGGLLAHQLHWLWSGHHFPWSVPKTTSRKRGAQHSSWPVRKERHTDVLLPSAGFQKQLLRPRNRPNSTDLVQFNGLRQLTCLPLPKGCRSTTQQAVDYPKYLFSHLVVSEWSLAEPIPAAPGLSVQSGGWRGPSSGVTRADSGGHPALPPPPVDSHWKWWPRKPRRDAD